MDIPGRGSHSSELQLLNKENGSTLAASDTLRTQDDKIDFILVYTQTDDEQKNAVRQLYEENLELRGLELRHVHSSNATVCKISLY